MTTVNLGRIKSVWRGEWASGIAYARDDVVKEGVNSYICVQAHTSGSTFAGDSANWNVMAVGAEIPSQAGYAGKVLKTDGTNLSWGQGGGIVQVVQGIKTDSFSTTAGGGSMAIISGLSASITMTDPNNKVLVAISVPLSANSQCHGGGIIYRNGIALGLGNNPTTGGWRSTFGFGLAMNTTDWHIAQVNDRFLDAPSGGTHTYTVGISGNGGSTIAVNRTSRGAVEDPEPSSKIILMEVAV